VAKVYDGTGADAFVGDILVENDRILAVDKDIECETAEIVDLSSKSVSAGFFDAHSHNDWFAIKNNPSKYFEPFVKQGITSFIAGNCGLSSTGYDADSEYIDKVGAGLFFNQDVTGNYGSVKDFFNAVDGKSPLNVATLIGHCSVRTGIAGYENRPLSKEELNKMLGIMEQGLKDGAAGISLGLMYEPGLYAPIEELREVAKLCEKYGKPLTVHPRACSTVSMAYPPFGRSHLLRALDELAEVTKGLKVKLQYSHAIFVGRNSFKCVDEFLEIIDKLKADGVDVMFDIYSEVCGVSVITVIMPAWYQAMTPEEKKGFKNKMKFKLLATVSKKLLGFEFSTCRLRIWVSGNEQFEGKSVAQIAKEIKKSELDTYTYLCEISNYKGRVNMYQYSTPEIIERLSKRSDVLYMTDAWVEDFGVQNLAIYDCFPKFLHLSLNGHGDTMEQTVRKMTGAVADRFGIQNRGYIKAGAFADLTIFDETELKNGKPDQLKAFGITSVYVNGKRVMNNGVVDQRRLRVRDALCSHNN
jgi:N-acyl-D-aspartate/D-glutamate deacylase